MIRPLELAKASATVALSSCPRRLVHSGTTVTSPSTTDRPGLRVLLDYARSGDVIVVHTLDRLGRTVRDTLNLMHELAERCVGVRNLADPIRVDSSNPADPMAQLAVVLLALFGQMERTYTLERAAHARAVATAKGRRVGRPVTVDRAQLDYAAHLRTAGHTIAEIVAKTDIPPDQPVPAPAAPAPRAGHRRRASRRRSQLNARSCPA